MNMKSLRGAHAWLERCNGTVAGIIALSLTASCGQESLERSDVAPMSVRQVVREVLSDKGEWDVVHMRPKSPPSLQVFSPFADMRYPSAQFDTGDKLSLLMSPPCETSFQITESDGPCDLVASAQISSIYTDRGFPGVTKFAWASVLDKLERDFVEVRFEVEHNGVKVFDEVVRHTHADSGEQRSWRAVGPDGRLAVLPGDRINLRTSFVNEQDAIDFKGHAVACGFGDLLLERWDPVSRQRATPERPNILLIVMDTLRADRMSCYGYPKDTTPNLDGLAAEGTLFEQAYATSSWTWPSTASILTGLLPYEHGVTSKSSSTLAYSNETVAEVLQAAGMTTHAITCNPLIDDTRLFDQGFEHFESSFTMRKTGEVIERIEQALADQKDSRFFMYLHLVDPHTPHQPLASELTRLGGERPADFPDRKVGDVKIDGQDHYSSLVSYKQQRDPDGTRNQEDVIPPEHRDWINARYDASVGTSDFYVGRILAQLKELGLDEKTIVVFTSDHGEELLDHGSLGHGHALWRELVRVPLIIAGPGIASGKRIQTEVSNRHLAPTLAMIGGTQLKALSDPKILIADEITFSEVFYQTSMGKWSDRSNLDVMGLRSEQYVIHHAPEGTPWGVTNPRGDYRLFSKVGDLGEQQDMRAAEDSPSRAAPLLDALNTSIGAQESRRQGTSIGVGQAGWRMLQGVGYVGADEKLSKPVESAGDIVPDSPPLPADR